MPDAPLFREIDAFTFEHEGRRYRRIIGGADPPPPAATDAPPSPDAPPPVATDAPPAAPAAPAPPRLKARPASAPTAAAAPVASDDIDAEELTRFRRWREEVESKRPELDRLKSDLARQGKEFEALKLKQRDADRLLAEQAETNFHLVLSARSATIGQSVGLLAEASEDLLVYLDRHTHTQQDGEDVTVMFRDGKVEVDLNDPEATKKIGEHLTKAKPHWIASRLSPGGGGAGRPAQVSGREKPPENVDELARALAKGQFTSIAGGRSAAGGR